MRRSIRAGLLVLTMWGMLAPCTLAEGADTAQLGAASSADLALHALSWLLPLGIALVAVGLAEPKRAVQVAGSLPLALAVGVLGYYATGFALQYGGAGLVSDHPDLAKLVAEWSPLDLSLGPGWGLVGLRGFGLPTELLNETVLTLFIAQLPLVTTAALIPLLALNGQTPRLPALALSLLVAAVGYPLAGNWLWGGGWLSQLGETLELGQGTMDYGMASLHVIGAGAALAGLAVFRSRTPRSEERSTVPHLPTVYLPLFVLMGAFLTLIGWVGVTSWQPLRDSTSSAMSTFLNGLLAASAAALAAMLYGWAARGEPDAGLTGRGLVAGLIAVSAGAPVLPPWGALAVGAIAGLCLAPTMYLFDRVLHLGDTAAVLSTHGAAALWGLVATGLLAATAGAEPAGYLLGGGAGQWQAQLLGAAAISILALLGPGVLLAVLAQAYQLPSTMRERARLRAEQIQLQREAREIMRRRGEALGLVQRVQTTLLNLTSGEPRLRARRRRPGQAAAPARAATSTGRGATQRVRRRRFSSSR
ncbi:MAG: hypothetical protein ACYC4R_08100 [Anaerolineae bacterium]